MAKLAAENSTRVNRLKELEQLFEFHLEVAITTSTFCLKPGIMSSVPFQEPCVVWCPLTASNVEPAEVTEETVTQSNQMLIGDGYEHGWGVQADHKEALRRYRLAADFKQAQLASEAPASPRKLVSGPQGPSSRRGLSSHSPSELLALAHCLRYGEGVGRDSKEAVRLYQLAADKGDPSAQFYLGSCCEKGVGVPKENQEALKWYLLSAGSAYINAQKALGAYYLSSNGTDPPQEKEAVRWCAHLGIFFFFFFF